jgi:hypothetical protein
MIFTIGSLFDEATKKCLPLGSQLFVRLIVLLIILSSTLIITFPASRSSIYLEAQYYLLSFEDIAL